MDKLTPCERTLLENRVRKARDVHEKDRLRVILARDDGLKPKMIAQVLRLSVRVIFDYLAGWEREKKTKHDDKGGQEPNLSKQEERDLINHLEKNTYCRVRAIISYVKMAYGISYQISGMTKWLKRHEFVYKKPKKIPGGVDLDKQQSFKQIYEELKQRIKADEEIYFCDATHPQYQAQAAYGWIRKGQIKTLATTGKQDRLHFAGALNLKKMKIVIKEYKTINGEHIIDFFKFLESSTTKKVIHVICDNGTAYKNQAVQEYLRRSKICIHYLPPYSPNLNPIERLWKLLKEYTCYNFCYPSFSKFKQAIRHFLFEKIPKMKNLLRDRINDHFEQISINPIKLAKI
jgi:transposase